MVTTTEQQREAFARLCLVTAEKHREEAAQLTFAALISPLEERELLALIVAHHHDCADLWERMAVVAVPS